MLRSPKGQKAALFLGIFFFSLPGILKQESQPRLCIKVTWGDLKKYGCPPPRFYLISLGWGLASMVLKAPQVILMGSAALGGLEVNGI